jgi:predicted nucleic-acid-binding protein
MTKFEMIRWIRRAESMEKEKVYKVVEKTLEKRIILILSIRLNGNNIVALWAGLVSFSSRQNP